MGLSVPAPGSGQVDTTAMVPEIRISAIIPNYNHGHLIHDAIHALAAQIPAPDEILVVDDASTDDSLGVLDRLQKDVPTLRVVALESNGGAINALNRGLREARGQYVYFGAADDVVLPGLFSALLDILARHPEAAFCSGECRVLEQSTGRVTYRPPARPSRSAKYFPPTKVSAIHRSIDNWMLAGAALIRRDLAVAAGGFDPALGAFADGYLMRSLAFAHGCCFVPRVGLEWRVYLDGVSRRLAANPDDSLRVLDKALNKMRGDPAFPAWYLPLFERRWRFSIARLAVLAEPINRPVLRHVATFNGLDRAVFAVGARVRGRLGRLALLSWLTLRCRPMSLWRLAATQWARRREARPDEPHAAIVRQSLITPDEQVALDEAEALMMAGKSVPLDLEETCPRIHLRNDPDNCDLLQRLCAVLASKDKVVPLDLEERALVALLKVADRDDLRKRLRTVRVALGKEEPPPALLTENGVMASQADVDHQAEARSMDARSNFGDMEPEFRSSLALARQYTMTSVERMYALYQAIHFIERANIPGAIVECGVWRGGSIMLALATLMTIGRTDRDIYLFDTFEGLPRPDDALDVDVFGNHAINGWVPHARGVKRSNWAYASLDDVKANVSTIGYPESRLHFVKGMVEDTIPAAAPVSIALLRLDTDWYASTRHEMEHLYPRLQSGGVLIIDDYGHFLGARKAVDEYLAANNVPLLLNRIDYSGRLGIKI
jgi:glycosyltransferase involved in cell wall biosynthesis